MDANGCTGTATRVVTVNTPPTVTLGSNPSLCRPATSTTISYSGATNSPNQYSIDYNNAANTAGLVDVVNANLPNSSIPISVPSGVAGGVYNATLTVRNSTTTCVSTTYPITVTVNVSPVISLQPVNTEYCRNNLSATFQATSSGYPAPTIQWQESKNGSSWTNISGANTLNYTFTPANKDDGMYYRALFSNNCQSNVPTNAVQLTINGGVNFPGQDNSAYMCVGGNSAQFCVKATGGVGQAGVLSFYWEYSTDGNPPWIKINGTDGSQPNSGNITTCYTATAGQLGYKFRAVFSNNGCLSPSFGGGVVTVPLPTAMNQPPSQTLCKGVSTQAVTFSGSNNVTVYEWTNSNTAIGLVGTGRGNIPSFVAQNSTVSPIVGTITVTPYDSLGGGVRCAGPSTTFTITVNPKPVVADPTAVTICAGGSTTLTVSGASTYTWSPATGLSATSGASVTANPTVTTTYQIIGLNTYGCADTAAVTVTVNSVTGGVIAADQPICSGGDPTPFTESTASTGAGTLAYQWQRSTIDCTTGFNNIAGATSTTYDAPTGLTVKTYYRRIVTSTFNSVSCTATSNCIAVSIHPIMTMGTCSKTNTTSYGSTTGSVSAGTIANSVGTVNYSWKNAGGTVVGTTATVNNLPAGVYTLTVNDDCTTLTCQVTILEAVLNATISGTTTVCEGDPSPNITFTNPESVPVTITYKINGGPDLTINVGANTTATVAAPTGTTGNFQYTLVSVAPQGVPAASNTISGSATVTVKPKPVLTNIYHN